MSERWPRVRLEEVLEQDREYIDRPEPRLYPKLSVKLYGKGVVLDAPADGALLKMKRHQIAHAGQVVLSEIWGKKGAIGLVPSEGEGALCTSHFFLFNLRHDRVGRSWLEAIFRSNFLEAQLAADAKGTTGYAAVRPKTLLACEIPLPPLAEQRRIVGRIEELEAKIAEARVLRQKASEEGDRLYTATLASVLTATHQDWRRASVSDVILDMDAGWSPQCGDRPAGEGEWGVLKTTAVQWCEFRPGENKALPFTLVPVPSLAVSEGDVLVTRAGPRKRVGVVAAVRKSESRLTLSDKLIRLRPNPEIMDYRFLELALSSPYSQEHLVHRKTGLADAQVNISQAILRATPIVYPSLGEQRRIVEHLDQVQQRAQSLRAVQLKTAAELETLLPAVLDRAFRGEL